MGIQTHMERSIPSAANFVYKTHIAVLKAKTNNIRVYPVMDGFYASCGDMNEFQTFIGKVLSELLNLFISEAYPHLRFIVRGGIAFGRIHHGRDLEAAASEILQDNQDHKNMILLGQPMIYAHTIEKSAPPFGLAVHDSAQINGIK